MSCRGAPGGGVVTEEKNQQRGSVPFLKPWRLSGEGREGATARCARGEKKAVRGSGQGGAERR
jgi:hypothetical protein